MSRTILFISLALTAAAVMAPSALSVVDPNGRQAVDPLAVSYLRNQGMSPGEIKVATQGLDPLAASYLRNHGFPQVAVAKAVDPLAASYIRNGGFPQVSTAKPTDPLAASYLRNGGFPQTPTEVGVTNSGFDWTDAGIGSAATLGAILLLAGLGAVFMVSRHNRNRRVASA